VNQNRVKRHPEKEHGGVKSEEKEEKEEKDLYDYLRVVAPDLFTNSPYLLPFYRITDPLRCWVQKLKRMYSYQTNGLKYYHALRSDFSDFSYPSRLDDITWCSHISLTISNHIEAERKNLLFSIPDTLKCDGSVVSFTQNYFNENCYFGSGDPRNKKDLIANPYGSYLYNLISRTDPLYLCTLILTCIKEVVQCLWLKKETNYVTLEEVADLKAICEKSEKSVCPYQPYLPDDAPYYYYTNHQEHTKHHNQLITDTLNFLDNPEDI